MGIFDKKILLSDVYTVCSLQVEEAVLFITKILSEETFSLSLIKKKYSNKEKYFKQSMLVLTQEKLKSLCDYLLRGQDETFLLECECSFEHLVFKKSEGTFQITFWEFSKRRYKGRMYSQKITVQEETAETFARSLREKISKEYQ